MGPHLADRHLQLGRLLGPNVALHHNLIDQVVSPSELLSTAAERCKEYIAVPFHSRSGTKARGAAAFVQLMEDGHEELVETLWKDIVREGPGSFKDIVGKMLKK